MKLLTVGNGYIFQVAAEDHDNKAHRYSVQDLDESNIKKQNSLPDYCEVAESEHGYEDARRNTDGEPRGKEASTRKDSSNFLMVSSRPASTSLTSNFRFQIRFL